MSNIEQADAIAEKLRQETYHVFRNDCITKSRRFKKQCRALGIPARQVACIGISPARFFGHWVTIPVIHGWGEVEGKRFETSRPLGASGIWGIIPMNIKPVVGIWF